MAVGHEVYALTGATVGRGTVTSIDNDGHYVVRLNERTDVTCVRDGVCHVTAAAEAPSSKAVREAAALRHTDERGTVQLLSRNEAERRTRLRAVRGELTLEEIAEIPTVFHPLLRHLQRPLSAQRPVQPFYRPTTPRWRKPTAPLIRSPSTAFDANWEVLSSNKAPGYSGNGPALHAPMPDEWAADMLALLSTIQHSGVTPHKWHVDLMHFVHKGGDDTRLSNHQPLALVDVMHKVFSAVATSRTRRDWARLGVLGSYNPGFQPGRSAVNAIYPLRMAAEQSLSDKVELVVFLDDLKWCFNKSAQVVIELALFDWESPTSTTACWTTLKSTTQKRPSLRPAS